MLLWTPGYMYLFQLGFSLGIWPVVGLPVIILFSSLTEWLGNSTQMFNLSFMNPFPILCLHPFSLPLVYEPPSSPKYLLHSLWNFYSLLHKLSSVSHAPEPPSILNSQINFQKHFARATLWSQIIRQDM